MINITMQTVSPGAMMIIAGNANAAQTTVARTYGASHLAQRTELRLLQTLFHLRLHQHGN